MASSQDKDTKLSLLLINGRNGSQKGSGTTEERRNLITEIIQQENPDVIMYQELSGPATFLGVGHLSMYTVITNMAESKDSGCFNGIAVRNKFECQKADLVGIDNSFRGRCPAVILKERGKGLLMVSYHGRKTKLNKDEITDLESLVQLVSQCAKTHKYDGVLIGGDFNLAARNVPRFMEYKTYTHSFKSIDYFLSNLVVKKPKEITLPKDKSGRI